MARSSGSWVDDMIAVWEFRGAQPTSEDETVALAPDGVVWLWVRTPADPERGDVVGSFRTKPGADRVEPVRAALAGLATGTVGRDDHRGSVTITAGPTRHTVPWHGAGGPAADAVRTGRALAREAFAAPLAAVRFAARLHPSLDLSALAEVDQDLLPDVLKASPSGPSALVGVVVEGLGSRSTSVIVAADRLQAHWHAGDRAVGWTELPSPDVGFGVRGIGDGIRVPAEVRPHETGALTVRADLPAEPADGVVVRVAGRIALVGPWDAIGVPDAPFEARTRRARLARSGG